MKVFEGGKQETIIMTKLLLLATLVAMDPKTAGLTLLCVALGVLANAFSPNSTWLPWSISGVWRTAIAAILTALITGANTALTGEDIGQSFLVALVTSSATWMVLLAQAFASLKAIKVEVARVQNLSDRMVEENRASQLEAINIQAAERGVVGKTNLPPPPVAGLFIIVALGSLLNQACTGTLEGSRPRLTSVAGVSLKLAEPGSQECLALSRNESTWNAASLGAGALGATGTVGSLVVLLERDDEASTAVYVALIAGGLLDAAAIFAKQVADGYNRDWVSLGCGKPAA